MSRDGTSPPSGRFVLRLPPALHVRLRGEAQRNGTSLNDWCVRKLSGEPGAADAVVARAREVLGERLVGVVAYGSWARGEAGDTSDVDVLLVADDDQAITRGLYRAWDERPVQWQGRPVDPHFVHVGAPISGSWVEAAIDGVILRDRDHAVGRRLVDVRHRIADGSIERRVVHGQPYWVGASA